MAVARHADVEFQERYAQGQRPLATGHRAVRPRAAAMGDRVRFSGDQLGPRLAADSREEEECPVRFHDDHSMRR